MRALGCPRRAAIAVKGCWEERTRSAAVRRAPSAPGPPEAVAAAASSSACGRGEHEGETARLRPGVETSNGGCCRRDERGRRQRNGKRGRSEAQRAE